MPKEKPNFLVSVKMIDDSRYYVTGQDPFGLFVCKRCPPKDGQKFIYKSAKIIMQLLSEQCRSANVWPQIEKIELVAFDVATQTNF